MAVKERDQKTILCARCGQGSTPGADSSLGKNVEHHKGSRDRVTYVHRQEKLCIYNLQQDYSRRQTEAAEAKRNQIWWRRLLRLLGLMGF